MLDVGLFGVRDYTVKNNILVWTKIWCLIVAIVRGWNLEPVFGASVKT